jgi:hypothetical protein
VTEVPPPDLPPLPPGSAPEPPFEPPQLETTLPPPASVPSSQRFPTWKQGIVLFAGSVALFLSACFGCLVSYEGRSGGEPFFTLFFIVGLAGLAGIVGGCVLLFMRILRALFSKKSESPS